MFLKLSRCFGFSTRILGHVMFSFVGTAQEAGAGGRSGAAGIPVHGSLMGHFSLCILELCLTWPAVTPQHCCDTMGAPADQSQGSARVSAAGISACVPGV